MGKKVTLADIAAEVGVSSVAVYKALSDKPGVSDELRERIKVLADQMGYEKAAPAKKNSLALKTGNIGVIVPERYYGIGAFYGQLYEKVVRALYKYEYYGILELPTEKEEKEKKLPRLFDGERVDGLLIIGQMQEEYIKLLITQSKMPMFFLDTYHSSLEYDTVISDGFHGAYMLTCYLIMQGHRKIGFVGSVDATSSISDRFWGYRKALRENHITFHDCWEIPDRDENGLTYETIVEDAEGMDAYVCNCDYTAYILIKNLIRKGYRVPEDVSVVGFDNFLPLGIGAEDYKITSYEVDMERMADVCVKSLIKKINGKRYMEGVQMITGKIIYKDTVLPKK